MSAIQWKPWLLNRYCQTCAQPDHVRGSTALILTPYVWAKTPRHRALVSTWDVVVCWHCCWHLSRRLLFLLLRSVQSKENCRPSYLPRSDATSVAPFCPIYFLSIGCHSNSTTARRVPEPEVSCLEMTAHEQKSISRFNTRNSLHRYNISFDRWESVERPAKGSNDREEMTRLQTWEGKQQRKNFTTGKFTEMWADASLSLPLQKTHFRKTLRAKRSVTAIRKRTNVSVPVLAGC